MSTIKQAEEYVIGLATKMTDVSLKEFFTIVHDKFYTDVDIGFMEYFLSLVQHEGEFIVPHQKLIEYGVATSKQSSNISQRLIKLCLTEDEDYQVMDVHELRIQGGTSIKHQYMLTPEAFKLCLMRSLRRGNQLVDPVIYANYFLLLEKIHYLFIMYEKVHSEYLRENLSKENKDLLDNVKGLREDNTVLKLDMEQVKHMNERLLELAEKQDIKLDDMTTEVVELKEDVNELTTEVTDLTEDVDDLKDIVYDTNDQINTIMEMQAPKAGADVDPMFLRTGRTACGCQWQTIHCYRDASPTT